ncbi:MAG: hypothetical protein HZB33_14785 [Nitrospirae bacterium]|nr:hypothetical protein [Nitrospirota bacterium]
MTRLIIDPGACGTQVTVEVQQKDKKTFSVKLESECKMVQKLGFELEELTLMDAFRRLLENPVYTKGAACLRHVACPVPAGILKALEVEAGLAVPRDVTMHFMRNKSE